MIKARLNQYNINEPGYGWTKVHNNLNISTTTINDDTSSLSFYCILCNASELPSWHFKVINFHSNNLIHIIYNMFIV